LAQGHGNNFGRSGNGISSGTPVFFTYIEIGSVLGNTIPRNHKPCQELIERRRSDELVKNGNPRGTQ
jgi:hypothetical protein